MQVRGIQWRGMRGGSNPVECSGRRDGMYGVRTRARVLYGWMSIILILNCVQVVTVEEWFDAIRIGDLKKAELSTL